MNIRDFKSTSITLVKTEVDFDRLKLLFLEFASSIDFDLCYQSFIQELSNIHEQYSPPNGIAFILSQDNNTIGCVGLRKAIPGVAIVKRLYIRSDFKRPHFGKQLLKVAIDWANQTGMKKLRLDPSDTVHGISKICVDEGFSEIYPGNIPTASSLACFEMKLSPKPEFSRLMAS
ncbi:MAG: GNAT family N-acetyltransferase [Bacteroidota bacterium]